MNKLWGVVAAVVLLMLLYGGWKTWLYFHDRNYQATVDLKRDKKELDSLRIVISNGEVLRKQVAEDNAKLRDSLDKANVVTVTLNRALKVTADRLDSALHVDLPPQFLARFDSMVAGFRGQLAGQEAIMGRQNLAIRGLLSDKAACDSAADLLQAQANAYKRQAEAWQERAQPSFLKRLVGWIPPFLAGGATVAIATVVVKGASR